MPVPKRKTSKARRDQRQSTKFIRPEAITSCANCQAPVNPHVVCAECGFYKGRKIMATKLDRQTKRSARKPVETNQTETQDQTANQNPE